MEEPFQIPITYGRKELVFNAQLVQFGYARKVQVDVNGIIIYLEKDDEGNFRAFLANIKDENKVDKELVKCLVSAIEQINS